MPTLRARLIALVRSIEDPVPVLQDVTAAGHKQWIPILRELARHRPEHGEVVRAAIAALKPPQPAPEPPPPGAPPEPEPEARWIPVGGGRMGLGHRPKLRTLPRMAEQGVTDVVTLLSEREGAPGLGRQVRAAGMVWTWIPLPNGDLPPEEREGDIARHLDDLVERLAAGATLFVHCSAGLHRTGMIGAALLSRLGLDSEATLATLRAMRPLTAEQVGTTRLEWATRFGRE